MKLLKIHFFLFVLFCIVASAMSMSFEAMAVQHHGQGMPCHGRGGRRRPQPNGGDNDGDATGDNNGDETGGGTEGA